MSSSLWTTAYSYRSIIPHFFVGRRGSAVEGRGSGEDLEDLPLAVPRHHGDRHLTPGDRRQATDH